MLPCGPDSDSFLQAAARRVAVLGSEWSCALHREQPRVRRPGQLVQLAVRLAAVDWRRALGLVWQAVEDELDLQLVGDLSGLGRMCWVVEMTGWLSVCLGGGRVVGGAAGYVGRLVGLGDLGDLGW